MTTTLDEDALYRTSTQYRLWSFSPEQLAERRRKTHELALARARQYSLDSTNGSALECLTAEEELRLVGRYCEIIDVTCQNMDKTARIWRENTKATAIQYLKRFYLSNSCMTYPPAEIYKTVMFMASKTEAIHLSAPKFAASMANTSPEAVLAPEYKIIQALRFTLDIRQPFRGLKGVMAELLNMANGRVGTVEGMQKSSGKEAKDSLLALKAPSSKCRTTWRPPPDTTVDRTHLEVRINTAFVEAHKVLDGPASFTDAYFLYTPSQILLAALLVTDEPLASFYLDAKIPTSSSMRQKMLATIHSCAGMLAGYNPKAIMTRDERAALEEKLNRCRDPTTKDLIKNHAAMKRNGAAEGIIDEQEAKAKKMKREASRMQDDVFGGPLLAKTNGNG